MLYVGNDTLVMLCNIVDPFGNYLTTGSITATIIDQSTNETIASVSLAYLGTPVTVNGRTFADGNWSGTLVGSTGLAVGDTYKVIYTCTSPVITFDHFEVAQTRLA